MGGPLEFHRGLDGYAPTPVRVLDGVARSVGVARVATKDESSRLGLPAFKILGASWAVERAAALRGLGARVFLPARSARARREAIAGEGAEVVVVDGGYEEAVARRRWRRCAS
jgi:diaminopropionate ammonia-lyase